MLAVDSGIHFWGGVVQFQANIADDSIYIFKYQFNLHKKLSYAHI